jgi:hypothetical protein
MNRRRSKWYPATAALMALPAFTFAGWPAHAQTSNVPEPLKQSANCMYEVLKTTPGVSEPKLGYVTSEGWTHPFLEYRAEETNRWVQPTRFEAQKADHGKFWFLATLPGLIDPRIGHLDIHVTEAVVQKWKAQCNVDANVLTV